MLTWGISRDLQWSPLLAIGACAAAAWRSRQIGLGFSYTIVRTVGWGAALKAGFGIAMAILGMVIGGRIALSLQALGLGGLAGGLGGWLLGDVLWNRKAHIRWDLVGTGAVILLFGWLGYLGGVSLGGSWFGQFSSKLITSLAAWAEGQQLNRLWISALVGVIGGGGGGGLAGGLTECLAELLGFRN